jgi:hypothetical protein
MFRLATKWFLGRLLVVAWFFVTASPLLLLMWWVGAHDLIDENRMFLDSVKWSLYDLRLRLAFMPVIGWWFTPDEDLTHHDDDEDD